jgi:hypothetical protein
MLLNLHFFILALAQCAITFSAATISIPQQSLRGRILSFRSSFQTSSTVLKLINAETDTLVTDLSQNLVVQLGSSISPTKLTIQVVVNGFTPAPQSVKITLTGPVNRTVIETGTYTLCGNLGLDFNPCTNLVYGKYNVKAELFTLRGALGTVISTTGLNFELKSPTVPSPVLSPVRAPISAPTQTCTVPRVRKKILLSTLLLVSLLEQYSDDFFFLDSSFICTLM